MTEKQYTPRPDSAPARVIAYLQEHGGTVGVAEVAAIIGRPAASATQNLQSALKSGLLVRHPDSSHRHVLFAVADGAAEASAPPVDKARGGAGRRRAKVAAQVAPVEAPLPIAAFWDDGDIVLHALQINGDNTATITVAHAQRLHAFLGRLFRTTQTAEAA